MRCPRAVIFDLDNTLSESFQAPKREIAEGLHKLLSMLPVAIMTGASFERMNEHFLPSFQRADRNNLYLFPDTAAQCFIWQENPFDEAPVRGPERPLRASRRQGKPFDDAQGKWKSIYKFAFTKDEYEKIMRTFDEAIAKTRVLEGAPRWGDLFLARDVQITFAGLGVGAPPSEKAKWDPDRSKRQKLKDYLDKKLPGFDVRISGRTAIDITGKEIDKAHGVKWFAKKLAIVPRDMIFVGDDLRPGGNDAVVIPTGIATVEVSGPHETSAVMEKILDACGK